MNRWLVGFLVSALLAAGWGAPGALAQEEPWMTDSAGDQQVDTAAGPAPDAIKQRYGILDLLELHVEEFEDHLALQWTVSDLSAHAVGTIGDYIYHEIRFTYGEVEFAVVYFRAYDDDVPFVSLAGGTTHYEDAYFGSVSGSGFVGFLAELELQVDVEAGTLAVDVPREYIRNQDGAPLLKDQTLHSFHALTGALLQDLAEIGSQVAGVESGIAIGDRMPDDGFGPDWIIQHGIEQLGHLGLSSERPYRASNGEATTFLYEVDVHNLGDEVDTVTFETGDVPNGWAITFPEQGLRMDPQTTETVPVLVTVPFRHEHGSTETMDLLAKSRYDPLAQGLIELGIHYVNPPQPAGHHDTVYIHSRDGRCDSGYFNTLETDEGSTGANIYPCGGGGGLDAHTWRYDLVLSPALSMGLDFDLEREGSISFDVGSLVPFPGMRASGSISKVTFEQEEIAPDFVVWRRVYTTLATLDEQEIPPLVAGGTSNVQLTVTPLAEADYVPYEANSELFLELEVTVDVSSLALIPTVFVGGQTEPFIAPGGWMQLPLNEYHDDVDQYFAAASGIDLSPLTPQKRQVNPGESIVFKAEAMNIGESAATYDLSLTGANVEWADVLGSNTFTLAAGSAREVAIVVSPPSDAAHGEFIDVTLHATKSDNENVRSILRMVAEVDTETDHPDESADAAATDSNLQSKPAPLGLLPPTLLGLLLLGRRGPPRNHNP